MNNLVVRFLQRLTLIVVLPCVGIYGCANPASDSAGQTSVKDGSAVLGAASVNQTMTEANPSAELKNEKREMHSVGKPGAAVKLKSVAPIFFATPGVYEQTFVLLSPLSAGVMSIDVSAADGISILSTERHFEFELKTDTEYSLPLTLNMTEEGRFYVQLHIMVNADGHSSTRAISAIVQVGAPSVKSQKAAAAKTANDSEAVISLPAQESISPR